MLVVAELDEPGRRAASWARRLGDVLGVTVDLITHMTNATSEHDLPEERVLEHHAADEMSTWLSVDSITVDHITVAEGDLDDAVVDEARQGDLVVLGVHHHEGVTRWALGSMPHKIAHRLPCPLVLVPPVSGAPDDAPILVGLDGSEPNRRVVEWAQTLATTTGRPLEAVYARNPMYDTFDDAGDAGETERSARLEAEMEDVVVHERPGSAERVLRDVAHDRHAFLTVVGVQEHHSFGGVLLGGLVDHLIHSAPGPIALVTHEAIARSSAHEGGVSGRAGDAARHVRRLVVATDAGGAGYAQARRAALHLARENGFDVILYDRSDERWTDTPHPEGPLTIDDVDVDDRPHLVEQMREFADAGVAVTAFLPSIPSITAIIDAVQLAHADAIMLPEELEHPRVMDRLLSERSHVASLVDHIAALELPEPPVVFVVASNAPVALLEAASRRSRPR